MASSDSRPVNLDLTKITMPVTAIASILHRVCAVISWVALGILIYAVSQTDLSATIPQQNNFFQDFVLWGCLSAFGYYCVGSLKHIIQDIGFFEDFEGGKMISYTALGLGVVLTIAAGVFVWA